MLAILLACLVISACASAPDPAPTVAPTLQSLSGDARLEYLREAAVWSPIDTTGLDVRPGPEGGRWPPGTVLACDFVLPEEKPGGNTPKFLCRTADGEIHKIKYGREDREVYGEIVGSRLLWALGFASDRVDPVTVRCRGCPEDPWSFMQAWPARESRPREEVRDFEPAIIESYYATPIESEPEQGVAWDEILSVTSRDPARARQQTVHRQALALLMGFLQHADSKPSQQTLGCPQGSIERDARGAERCVAPEVYVGDVGAILGDGWKYLRASTSKVDYALWKETPVWRHADACVLAVNGRPNASLGDVAISEPARRFLAERLRLLRREQIESVFAVARVELLGETLREASGAPRAVRADDWADLFVARARAITEHRCPEPTSEDVHAPG